MGIEVSKQSKGALAQINSLQTLQKPQPWTLLANIPLNKWKPEIGEIWGFDHVEEWWKSKFVKCHKRPWSRFSVTYRNSKGKDDKLCSFTCEVAETGREEKLHGLVKDLSIIAFHPLVIVVQVVLSKCIKLLVVNWQTSSLLGTYTFSFGREPCYQECIVNPDATYLLCRQNFLLRRKCHHVMSFDARIRVIQVKDGLCRRLFVIEDSLVLNTLGSGISFDPRYSSGRVTIMGSRMQENLSRNQQDLEQEHGIQVYDIQERRMIQSAESRADRLIHHIRHSPDGTLLAAVCVNISVYISCNVSIQNIQLYDSDTLQLLHTITMRGEVCKISCIPIFPMFSRNGDLAAVCTGDVSAQVQIFQMPSHCETLQELCRHVIVRVTCKQNYHRLPLPPKMISFLKYELPVYNPLFCKDALQDS